MCFYDDWNACLAKNRDDYDYIEAFLKKKDFTTRILIDGTSKQLEVFCKLLLNYNIEKIIDVIDDSFYSTLTPRMIVQFSNFKNATTVLTQILYSHDDLLYEEVGKELIGSEKLGAAKKYGENHSKLAKDFELVTISDSRPAKVKITNFGKCFAFFDEKDQIKLIRVLALRDPLIENLIIKGKHGLVSYSKECDCLSESTKNRRKGNVRQLVELIFEGINSQIVNNIVWEI